MKFVLMLIAAVAACKSKEPPPSAGDPAGSPVAGAPSTGSEPGKPNEPGAPASTESGASATADATAIDRAGHNMTGLRPHQAANCPASVPGATTRIAMTPRGVDVSVTAKEPVAVRRIVELAQLHAGGRTAEVPRPHDQKHGGPGRVGYCPVVVTGDTTVTVTPIAHGATVHVEARSPGDVAALQEMVKARAVKLPGYLSS